MNPHVIGPYIEAFLPVQEDIQVATHLITQTLKPEFCRKDNVQSSEAVGQLVDKQHLSSLVMGRNFGYLKLTVATEPRREVSISLRAVESGYHVFVSIYQLDSLWTQLKSSTTFSPERASPFRILL
eukprot:TRINITY_DN1009_c0_g2_i1.p3 TRINITY_DN1009_c0_g2~~TRINITY_DN1009_c0_g2_i1.p3  ORF type:complete len:126 (+),score=19.60 TRINITY_DN1009_c0_g2_i1:308-685(+)